MDVQLLDDVSCFIEQAYDDCWLKGSHEVEACYSAVLDGVGARDDCVDNALASDIQSLLVLLLESFLVVNDFR
jgi:hypothetical protein